MADILFGKLDTLKCVVPRDEEPSDWLGSTLVLILDSVLVPMFVLVLVLVLVVILLDSPDDVLAILEESETISSSTTEPKLELPPAEDDSVKVTELVPEGNEKSVWRI